MIEFIDVTFKYNASMANGENKDISGVEGINIKIEDGEFILFTGSSGCGKSTMIRLINGLIPHFYNGKLEGNITLDGKNLKDMSLYDISKRVGSVFQNPRSQFFNVNTTDEIAFASENQCHDPKEILERIYETSNLMNIEKLLDRNIFELSGGEKQIIACAGINVLSPDIIVLDEPSSNLDHYAINKLKGILKIWKEEGKTIIIAEHRLFYLKDLVDKMILMDNGKIIKEFKNKELKNITYKELDNLGLRPLSLLEIPFKKENEINNTDTILLKDFSFSYKDKIHSINIKDLSIPTFGITAIIGHNGAGKSTLVRNICGLEKRCKGTFKYKNKVMNYKERLQNCYMIMQDVNHQLFTESVIDEVMLSITDKKIKEEEKREKAKEILKEINLLDEIETHPMALSGGQKQRCAIASGIASSKPIIILDEPTSGLDLNHMKMVAKQIKELKEKGKTVIVVTHDYEFILRCCDYIIHMENGLLKEAYSLNEKTSSKLYDFINNKGENAYV